MKKTQDMLSAAVGSIRSQFKIDTSAAEKSLEKNDASKTMSQAAGQMEKQETEQAESSLEDADKQMSDLITDMDALGARMTNSNTAEIKRRLFAALNQLIIISEKEEALGDSLVKGDPSAMAQEQLAIIEGFQKAEGSLSRLGELVMEIIPVIEQVTENSRQMMTGTMDALSKGDTAQGGELADQTLQTLNTSINFLTQLIEKSDGSQGGSGLSGDLMQQLQQIANGQLNLQQMLSRSRCPSLRPNSRNSRGCSPNSTRIS